MAKGYWIAHAEVSDPEAYERYREANAEAFRKFGGRFLVRGGKSDQAEGSLPSRHVVIEFPSYQAAFDCYHSEVYQAAKALRINASIGDLIIVDGYDGPQPSDE